MIHRACVLILLRKNHSKDPHFGAPGIYCEALQSSREGKGKAIMLLQRFTEQEKEATKLER